MGESGAEFGPNDGGKSKTKKKAREKKAAKCARAAAGGDQWANGVVVTGAATTSVLGARQPDVSHLPNWQRLPLLLAASARRSSATRISKAPLRSSAL